MNKYILFLIFFILLIAGCSNKASDNATGNTVSGSERGISSQERTINIEKLEVYHFHGTNQCHSCKTVGAYAEETANTYFSNELKSGKIVFGHINAELPENQELAMKYGISSASLWLGVYDKNGFHPEQNTNVWYKISNKEEYMSYLKGIIEQKLAGN